MIERKTTENEVGDHKSRILLTYKKYLAWSSGSECTKMEKNVILLDEKR